MKNTLVLLLAILSYYVIADQRFILGSLEGDIAVGENEIRGFETPSTSIVTGLGARLLNFKDEGLYFGTGFKYLTGERKICFIFCDSYDANETSLFGEIGRNMGQWTPFVGVTFHSSEVVFPNESVNNESWGLDLGFWLEYDKFKLRGVLINLNDEDYRTFSVSRLVQTDNKLVLGYELGWLLDSEIYQFSFSLQIGRSF
ncbi:MAG: hypothetical protein F4W92_09155 [Gammaproteobacteria bacterium]|nr:hypothetical protein [Gammaproteobacteria bacterium]